MNMGDAIYYLCFWLFIGWIVWMVISMLMAIPVLLS